MWLYIQEKSLREMETNIRNDSDVGLVKILKIKILSSHSHEDKGANTLPKRIEDN